MSDETTATEKCAALEKVNKQLRGTITRQTAIDELLAEEGTCLELFSDVPSAVIVHTRWLGVSWQRFNGANLADALQAAVKAKREAADAAGGKS